MDAESPRYADLDSVRAINQQQLIDFVTTDIELALTFLETARISGNPEHKRALIEKARTALVTVRRFAGQIEDPDKSQSIHSRANRLEGAISNT